MWQVRHTRRMLGLLAIDGVEKRFGRFREVLLCSVRLEVQRLIRSYALLGRLTSKQQ
jgi:hypothetical protein